MSEIVLHPTHHCFDDALDFLRELATRGKGLESVKGYLLCHGIGLLPETDEPYAHAWVEKGEMTFNGFLLNGELVYGEEPKSQFYETRRIREVTRYTPIEALIANQASGHYGPWLEKYRELCRDRKARTG